MSLAPVDDDNNVHSSCVLLPRILKADNCRSAILKPVASTGSRPAVEVEYRRTRLPCLASVPRKASGTILAQSPGISRPTAVLRFAARITPCKGKAMATSRNSRPPAQVNSERSRGTISNSPPGEPGALPPVKSAAGAPENASKSTASSIPASSTTGNSTLNKSTTNKSTTSKPIAAAPVAGRSAPTKGKGKEAAEGKGKEVAEGKGKGAASAEPTFASGSAGQDMGQDADRDAGHDAERLSDAERQRRIAEAAYRKAQERGFSGDRQLDDWLEAEREHNKDPGSAR